MLSVFKDMITGCLFVTLAGRVEVFKTTRKGSTERSKLGLPERIETEDWCCTCIDGLRKDSHWDDDEQVFTMLCAIEE
eukprot:gene950-18880_t